MVGSKRGPAPKRDGERERRNVPTGGDAAIIGPDDLKNLPFDVELLVEPPPAGEKWEHGAKQVYEATLRDPARIWMGPLDWAAHWLFCESMSRDLAPQYVATVEGDGLDVESRVVRERLPLKGASITGYLKWFGMIGVGESSRLALRREVTFNDPPRAELASVSEIDVSQTREGFFQDGGR